jgi:hypothetical protein
MFIRNIMRAIAQAIGLTIRHTEATLALQTQTVGPASQEPTTQPGNQPSAQPTNSQPVPTEQKAKRSRARKTTAEASPKQERTSAKRTAIQPGQQQATPAFPTPRRVGRPRKVKA